MLKFVIPDRKKPTPPITWPSKYTYPVAKTPETPVNTELFKEAQRRDKIIKELVKGISYKQGDNVVPAICTNPDDEQAVVVNVCSCYAHMGKDNDWPKSDNPMIVTAKKKSDNTVYFCTTNYLKKA